jgi:hypothetical protein
MSGVLPVGVTGGSGLSIATTQLGGQVTLAQLPTIANDTILGNNSGSAGVPIALTVAQVNAILPVFTSSLNGLVPASGGGTANFLRADGTFAAPSGATSGTVTSVGFADLSTAPIYTVTNSPVTTSGTLDITLNTQAANSVFAGPTTGSAAQPAFRSLVVADLSFAGAASGVATLDGSGKIPLSQLPATLMEFKGSWNPNTNTPALVDGTGTTGFTYWVSALDLSPVAGLSDPSMYNFQIGDLVIYNGSAWVLVTPAAGVQSVNGAQGAVVMSMATANGFAGTYTGTALTVSTTITGILQGNGTAISAASTTGSGAVVLATNPVFVTPNLGTPSAIVLTNASGVLPVGVTGGSGLSIASTQLTGQVAIANGGTGQSTAAAAFAALSPLTTAGDIIIENNTPAPARLGIGSTGQVLTVVAGLPAWSNTAVTAVNAKETFVLSGTDITNQFVTLAHTPLANSTDLLIQGAGDQLEGASYDYTVSGATIVFQNGLATGGVSALVAGDILQVQYEY